MTDAYQCQLCGTRYNAHRGDTPTHFLTLRENGVRKGMPIVCDECVPRDTRVMHRQKYLELHEEKKTERAVNMLRYGNQPPPRAISEGGRPGHDSVFTDYGDPYRPVD